MTVAVHDLSAPETRPCVLRVSPTFGRAAQRSLACALLLGLLAGCGGSERPSLEQVTGTVTLDGKPVEGAIVAFQRVTEEKEAFRRPSSGITDAGGKFTLGTYDKSDGVPVGTYLVGVYKRDVVGELPANYNEEQPEATPVKYKWTVPRAYADPNTSGLKAEVTSKGLEPAVFALDSGGGTPEVEVVGGNVRRPNDP